MTSGPAPGANLGSYRIDSLLGRGGMGVVYLAEHIHLGRKVALKVLAPDMADDEEFRQRFLRESQMAARVEHKNIIPVYDAGEADGLLYISMRYVDGSDLKTLITERAPLQTDYALGLMGQVASALDAAHKHGLVHRDVKPGNILIEPDGSRYGRVYLTDFGLTKMANSHTSVTKTGMFLGSIDYAAPEQWEGKQLDGRTDIYALGCVAFECLTGEVPYLRETPLAAMHAHLMEPPPRVGQRRPDLGDDIDRGIQRAMAKSPDDRHFDCLSFIDEMRGRGLHRGQAGGTAAHASPPGQPGPQPGAAGATVAAAGGAAAAGFAAGPPVEAPSSEAAPGGTSGDPAPAGVMDESGQAPGTGDLAPTGVMEGRSAEQAPTGVMGGRPEPTAVEVAPRTGARKTIPPFLVGFAAVLLLAGIAGAGYLVLSGGDETQSPTAGDDDGTGNPQDDQPKPDENKDGGGDGGGNGSQPIPLADLRIAFRSDADGDDDVYVIDGRGDRVTTITATSGVSETDPAWSSDGSLIAFESDQDGDHDIYVVGEKGAATGDATNVTDSATDESNPTWSPDGNTLAFNSGGGVVADIFSIDVDGGSPVNLTNTPTDESDPTWSPDGEIIAFESGPEGARDIFGIDSSGSTPTSIAAPAGDDIDPEWSPDGQQLAFSSDGDIFVVNRDGSGLKRVLSRPSVDTDPTWSPDGRRIAFEAEDATGVDIYLVSVSGGEAARLTSEGSDSDPVFQPN